MTTTASPLERDSRSRLAWFTAAREALDRPLTAYYLLLASSALLLTIGVNFFILVKAANGKAGERQVEPTQLAALQQQLEKNHEANQRHLSVQTSMLSAINREVGEVKTAVDIVKKDVDGFHQRVGGISRELAATSARVDGLEKREDK